MRLVLLLTLLALTAFFAAAELSLIRLRPTRVQGLVEEKAHGAVSIHRLQRRLKSTLMVSQLGGTLALVALGWLGKGLANRWWPLNNIASRAWDIALFLLIAICATLIAGLLPKALVLNRPETAGLRLAPILEAVMGVLSPVLSLLEAIASFLLRLVGLTTKWDALVPALSADELESLIESGGVTGLRPDERNILEGVFALHDTQVREVMVPRSGMVTLPLDVRFSELMKAVHRTQHARFLVIGDSLDDVHGVLDLRRLAEPISRGLLEADTRLAKYLQPVPKVLETSTLAALLPLIRRGHPLLLVVDEYGGTEGLVTAADLTGDIVGDELQVQDNKLAIQSIDGSPGRWLIAGELEIIELNRQLNLDLPEANDHHTIAGFLLEKMQHIPTSGECLQYKNLRFEITAMQGPRIERVRLSIAFS